MSGLRCLLSVSTLSRLCSTWHLPALFHTGSALGVSPRGPASSEDPDALTVIVPSCGSLGIHFSPTRLFRSITRISCCVPVSLCRADVPAGSAPRPYSLQTPVISASLFRLSRNPRPSLGFASLGLSLYPPLSFLAIILSCAWFRTRLLNPKSHFRALPADSLGMLSQACPPFRGLSPFELSHIFEGQGFLGRPSGIIQCCHRPHSHL
jgi:hypothetical protein